MYEILCQYIKLFEFWNDLILNKINVVEKIWPS